MSVTRLKVTYRSQYVDSDLDKKVLEFFNKLDFVCINRDYNHLTWERELVFERHTKEETVKEARARGVDVITEGKKYGSKRDKKVKLTT